MFLLQFMLILSQHLLCLFKYLYLNLSLFYGIDCGFQVSFLGFTKVKVLSLLKTLVMDPNPKEASRYLSLDEGDRLTVNSSLPLERTQEEKV